MKKTHTHSILFSFIYIMRSTDSNRQEKKTYPAKAFVFSFYHCLSSTCFFLHLLLIFLPFCLHRNEFDFIFIPHFCLFTWFSTQLWWLSFQLSFSYVLPSVFHITFRLFVWFSLRFFHHQTWFVSHVRDINTFFLRWIGLRWKKKRRKKETWIVVKLKNIFFFFRTLLPLTPNTLLFRFQSNIHLHSHTQTHIFWTADSTDHKQSAFKFTFSEFSGFLTLFVCVKCFKKKNVVSKKKSYCMNYVWCKSHCFLFHKKKQSVWEIHLCELQKDAHIIHRLNMSPWYMTCEQYHELIIIFTLSVFPFLFVPFPFWYFFESIIMRNVSFLVFL